MGLDMYLNKRTYIGAEYKHREVVMPNLKITIGDKVVNINPTKVSSIEERAGYWRKANAIHKWFVDNVQDGVDECQETEVDKPKLAELLVLCRKVVETAIVKKGRVCTGITSTSGGPLVKNYEEGNIIANAEDIHELLPTSAGPFFGSTDYDQWYLQDVKDTIAILEACDLDEKNYDVSYRYQASW